ncbi:MAG: hypothetical protein JWO78_511 [Micavibrio sp.]|nr:hypothetical protein [Micavibrio sp.]
MENNIKYKKILRNWLLPPALICIFVALGIIIIGLPSFDLVTTIDGVPIKGTIPNEQLNALTQGDAKMVSHLNFYGINLIGKPIYWYSGIILVCVFLGYKLQSKLRIKE